MLKKVDSISDSRVVQKAIEKRLESLPHDFQKIIVDRDDVAIIAYIESQSSISSNINENFKVAVLQLTIQNDPETLQSVLTWGAKMGLTPATGEDDSQERQNPILVACQQDFKRCMQYLYQHGYRRKNINKEEKEEDQVKKFQIFKASSNIHYLSLEFTEHQALQIAENSSEPTAKQTVDLKKLDPIQRVYELMKDADENMEDFQGSSELKSSYIGIKNDLEVFLVGILDQCKNMCEVETILDHNRDDDDDDELDDSSTNCQKALYDGHKHFVSHPNFQQYIWRQMTGDGSINTHIPFESIAEKVPLLGPITKFRIKRALWNFKNVPLTLFSFIFCYTGVVLADLFREADILFVSPKAMREREKENSNKDMENQTDIANGCFDYYRSRMHIPLFRMIPYFFFHVAYLVLLCMSIWHPVEPVRAKLSDPDDLYAIIVMSITFLMTSNLLVDDIINLFRPQHRQSCWSMLSLISHLLLVGGSVTSTISYYVGHQEANTRLADLSGNDSINVGMVMLSFGAGIKFFSVLRWLVLLETTGPIVLCVLTVIGDALRMVSIYLVLFVAHAIAFWSLYKPFRADSINSNQNNTRFFLAEDSMKTQRGLISSLFWRIIASAGPEMANIKTNDEDDDFSMEFSHLMGLVLWGIYQIIIYVLMLNLLIAVMNTSYSELWQNIQVEWKYNKSSFQAEFFNPLEIFPVPFRWIYYIAKAVYKCKTSNGTHANKQDNLKYYKLVRRLIRDNIEAELGESSHMKNNDLKLDILNELKKLTNLK